MVNDVVSQSVIGEPGLGFDFRHMQTSNSPLPSTREHTALRLGFHIRRRRPLRRTKSRNGGVLNFALALITIIETDENAKLP